MKSKNTGINTLINSITNIAPYGFWMLCNEKEYFISFTDYPAFKKASVDSIFNVVQLSPKQFYWADIDVDIELDALENPQNYTLVFKT
ncbi:MAG: DUF2442 domain-containing protein [Bacteroidales bacterium]